MYVRTCTPSVAFSSPHLPASAFKCTNGHKAVSTKHTNVLQADRKINPNGTSVSPGSDTRRTERAQHAASHQTATTLQQKQTSVHCNYSSNCCNTVTMSVAHHGSPVVVCTVSRTACTLCTMAQGSCPVPLPATAAAASVATRKLSRNSHNSGR